MDFASRTPRVIGCVSHGCHGPGLLQFLQGGSSAEPGNQTIEGMLEENSTLAGLDGEPRGAIGEPGCDAV